MANTSSPRLQEIDFLRGIAVILVLFRHHRFLQPLQDAGWVGVDLFFVLSGFLVSGLLFKEYQRFGNIKPGLFLIRRGFKIYPLFYFTVLCMLLIKAFQHTPVPAEKLLAELFFVQNYFPGIFIHTWSLAVEEHFYLGLALLVSLLSWKRLLSLRSIQWLTLIIAILCFLFRLLTLSLPYDFYTHLLPTHLRIDSLFFGVFLSAQFHFNTQAFRSFFSKYRIWLYLLSLACISVCFIWEVRSPFMFTIGYTILYTGFGLLLSLFVSDENISEKLQRFLSKSITKGISRTGFYSYAIYLWHIPVAILLEKLALPIHYRLDFLVYFVGSIATGIVFSRLIEQSFLRFRDRRFPGRSSIGKP